MLDRNIFLETLKEVQQIVNTAAEPMSREEILSYFKDMSLTDEQRAMVFQYLTTEHEEPENTGSVEEPGEVYEGEESSRALRMYMDELDRLPELTEEEATDMCEALLNGDSDMISRISEAVLPDVASFAEEYVVDKVDIEDIIQEGNLAVFTRLSELVGMGAECGYDVMDELKEAVTNAMKAYVEEMTRTFGPEE